MTFLVMELVEGEDLSDRIGRGPIPVAEALPLALQIAQALEAAHEQGVILHEMLTGKRLFDGETISHTLADVLRAPIDIGSYPEEVPSSVRRLVGRCLERDRMRRLRDIGEARIALDDALNAPDEPAGEPGGVAVRRSPLTRVLPWVIAAAAVVLATVAFFTGSKDVAPSGCLISTPRPRP